MDVRLRDGDNMLQINFDSVDDLVSFLLEKHIRNPNDREFPKWETVIFRISSSDGSSLVINTLINDNRGNDDNYNSYLTFGDNIDTFIIEYEKRKHLGLNIEIKLKFPNSFKMVMDRNEDFKAFYLNFYIENSNAFILTSFIEKDKYMSVQPIKDWVGYIAGLYKKWEEWRKLQN